MKYQEIFVEYRSLLKDSSRIRLELAGLPKGVIAKKKISGKEYQYLQYTVCGKKKTEYLKQGQIAQVQNGLVQREQLRQELEAVNKELERLEGAVKILEPKMSMTFYYLRQCADMDAMPVSKRSESMAFSNAMTALEGLPAKEDTENHLRSWASGQIPFADVYLPVLKRYGILEGGYA